MLHTHTAHLTPYVYNKPVHATHIALYTIPYTSILPLCACTAHTHMHTHIHTHRGKHIPLYLGSSYVCVFRDDHLELSNLQWVCSPSVTIACQYLWDLVKFPLCMSTSHVIEVVLLRKPYYLWLLHWYSIPVMSRWYHVAGGILVLWFYLCCYPLFYNFYIWICTNWDWTQCGQILSIFWPIVNLCSSLFLLQKDFRWRVRASYLYLWVYGWIFRIQLEIIIALGEWK